MRTRCAIAARSRGERSRNSKSNWKKETKHEGQISDVSAAGEHSHVRRRIQARAGWRVSSAIHRDATAEDPSAQWRRSAADAQIEGRGVSWSNPGDVVLCIFVLIIGLAMLGVFDKP
jgi:hypothetical protein